MSKNTVGLGFRKQIKKRHILSERKICNVYTENSKCVAHPFLNELPQNIPENGMSILNVTVKVCTTPPPLRELSPGHVTSNSNDNIDFSQLPVAQVPTTTTEGTLINKINLMSEQMNVMQHSIEDMKRMLAKILLNQTEYIVVLNSRSIQLENKTELLPLQSITELEVFKNKL